MTRTNREEYTNVKIQNIDRHDERRHYPKMPAVEFNCNQKTLEKSSTDTQIDLKARFLMPRRESHALHATGENQHRESEPRKTSVCLSSIHYPFHCVMVFLVIALLGVASFLDVHVSCFYCMSFFGPTVFCIRFRCVSGIIDSKMDVFSAYVCESLTNNEICTLPNSLRSRQE